MITDIKPCGGCYRLQGKTYWPLFGCEVTVTAGDGEEVSAEYAEKCVAQLFELDQEATERLLKASIRYFADAEYCHGEPVEMMFEFEGMEYPEHLEDSRNILPYIKPVGLYIDREAADCLSVSVFAECAWEPEHGMQWVVRDGKPLYVGAFDGLGSHSEERIYSEIWKDSNYLLSGGEGRTEQH